MVNAAASSNRDLFELSSNDTAEINLHAVESISDLHCVSSRHDHVKGSEGSAHSQLNTTQTPHGAFSKHVRLPDEDDSSFLPPGQAVHIIPACTCCPCFSPTCCPTGFFALLGVLVVASLALATLAVYLSVLQSESLRVLARWLESQEATIRQMRAMSLHVWSQLNVSDPGART
ncbi:leucine-rich single-pass membrane protein 2 isoform X2 [Eublepharis macularius]|nr:leucine-rich single-pass membrane protein 2 isoform X2 [Eublepharis macularius]